MSKWLEETHGIQFELLRHFLLRFFDSDLITAPGQATPAVIGAISIFMPWFAVMISPLKHKYAYLSSLESADVYLRAVRADQLWLITLMMSTIGLLTAIKWQSVFPGLRDYRALAALPLRSYQIFQAKLTALLIAATAAIFVLNLFPSVIFPMISGGRWALNPFFGVRVGVHTIVCAAGSYFFFFSFIALQGALLVLLKRRLFERVSGVLQSALVPLMLVFIVLSFSIEPKVTATVLHPHFAAWLPPVWFLGLYQRILGDRDPEMQVLATRAVGALIVSILLSFSTYAVSYQRHRTVLIEGPSVSPTKRRRDLHVLDWLFPDPCQQAVIQFMLKTLAGSNQHRMILTAYAGSGFAVLLTAMVGLARHVHRRRKVTRHDVRLFPCCDACVPASRFATCVFYSDRIESQLDLQDCRGRESEGVARSDRSARADRCRRCAAGPTPVRIQDCWTTGGRGNSSIRNGGGRFLRSRLPFLGKAAIYVLATSGKNADVDSGATGLCLPVPTSASMLHSA
jgi:hypothetical protein